MSESNIIRQPIGSGSSVDTLEQIDPSDNKCDYLFCKDDEDNNVDWFILYKLGDKFKRKSSSSEKCDGLNYMYIVGDKIGESETRSKKWIFSDTKITSENSMLANTLKPLYDEPTKYTWILYNDRPPRNQGTRNGNNAYAKGVIAMGKESGFFLMHTFPEFPESFAISKKYKYSPAKVEHAQAALCVSFKTQEEANNILNYVHHMKPNIYDWYDAHVLRDNSAFEKLVKENSAAYCFKSYNGNMNWTAFSKNANFNRDLYANLIAPSLGIDLNVKTWHKGKGLKFRSLFRAQNITKCETQNYTWNEYADHSKWAISKSKMFPWFCFADTNRTLLHHERGGGAWCVKDETIWQLFNDLMMETEKY